MAIAMPEPWKQRRSVMNFDGERRMAGDLLLDGIFSEDIALTTQI
jgi:hypothetical protein